MISVAKDRAEPGISLINLPIPTRAGDDVLVRVDTVGICGSDLHAYEWIPEYHWLGSYLPAVLGHEITGTIVELPPNSRGFHVGQRVAVRPALTCGTCELCQRGMSNRCPTRKRLGYELPGGLAEYMVAPSTNVYAIPPGVGYESAALIEPLTVALHALNKIKVRQGSRVAVVGPGAIGLLAAQLLKGRGAGEVLVVGTELDAAGGGLELADTFGGRGLLSTETAGVTASCEVVIVTAGAKTALDQSFDLVAKGGTVCVIALGIGEHNIDIDRLVRSELNLVGSFGSVQSDWLDALELLDRGLVRGDSIVSDWLPLNEAAAGFEKLMSRTARKIVIVSTEAKGEHNDPSK